MARIIDRCRIEEEENWEYWFQNVPPISFDPSWKVCVVPPIRGAMARFLVWKDGKRSSVYLDCHDRLGYYGEPYWEVYPFEDDVGRCAINDTDELLRMITVSLAEGKSA